jgi:hypothetical protein
MMPMHLLAAAAVNALTLCYLRLQIQKANFIKKDAAKVEVQFQEKADAMFKGEVHDSYKNDYSIEYHLTRHNDTWKISGSRVTQDSVDKVSTHI